MPGAGRQIAKARDWWFAHRDKAPTAFDDDLEALFGLLEQHRDSWVPESESGPGVRRVLLNRVRYHV